MVYGMILQINVKSNVEGERGIPKLPVESALVGINGLEGDFNRHRHEKRDSLEKAVLILTSDVILDLIKEDWQVKPGHLGENFTVGNVPYDFFKFGERYSFGKEVLLRISEESAPCRNLAVLPYVGKEKLRELQRALLGKRGWYASVIKGGYVEPGDLVRKLQT